MARRVWQTEMGVSRTWHNGGIHLTAYEHGGSYRYPIASMTFYGYSERDAKRVFAHDLNTPKK